MGGIGPLGFQPGVKDGCFGGLTVVFVSACQFIFDDISADIGLFGAECFRDALLLNVVLVGRDDGVEQDQDTEYQQDRGEDGEEATATFGLTESMLAFFRGFGGVFLNRGACEAVVCVDVVLAHESPFGWGDGGWCRLYRNGCGKTRGPSRTRLNLS